nr:HAD family hydrolase [Aneurinibacillus sp. XH2]
MKPLLIVTDMDGTLLDGNQQISSENERAIRSFIQSGGLFTLATGRMEAAVIPFIRQLDITTPVILYNGARIYCPVTKEIVYEKLLTVTASLWQTILEALTNEFGLLVYAENDVYSPVPNHIVREHEHKEGVRCKPWNETLITNPITKILVIAEVPEQLHSFEKIVMDSGLSCETVYSEHNYFEILPEGASKGTALQVLTEMLQIKELHTIAVGDNLNDISMIQAADTGIAVANAHPELKAQADQVTVHHEQHAIAQIITELMS